MKMNQLRRGGKNEKQPRFDEKDMDDSFFWKSQSNFERSKSVKGSISSATNIYQQNQDVETSPGQLPQKVLWKALLVWFLSVTSSVLAILSSIFYFSSTTVVALVVALVVAGTVAYKEHLLLTQPTLRTEINQMRELKTDLASAIDVMQSHVDDLIAEKERLDPIERAMSDVAVRQGINVGNMVELVKKSEIQTAKFKKVLLKFSIEEIIKIMLQSDWNNNFKIDNNQERNFVTMRAEIKLSSMGIFFNKKIFEEEIRKHSDLATIIKNLRESVLENEDPDRQILFCDAQSSSKFSESFIGDA